MLGPMRMPSQQPDAHSLRPACSWRFETPGGPLSFGFPKNFDTSCSMGPCIVVGEVDPTNVDMETLVNGECRQRFNTRDMVFTFGEYLEYLSRDFTLYPGDIISGGTAAGTAADFKRIVG